jgi:hypothetical protein
MTKTKAADFKVDDPAEAMRRTIRATRAALAVPKAKIDSLMAKEKAGRSGRKRK